MTLLKKAFTEIYYSAHMGSDLSVVNAARQSFAHQKDVLDQSDVGLINFLATGKRSKEWDAFLEEVMGITDKKVLKQRLIEYKREAQHWAPFGHAHLTLRLRMPIFLARQFVKHTVGGTWSEESRRYISGECEYYFEPVLESRPEDIKQGAGATLQIEDQQSCMGIMDDATLVADVSYKQLLKHGLAPEQAREILPLNMMTGVTWTGSLLFWARVCNQRLDPHAQRAARLLAEKISSVCNELFPISWAALVKVPFERLPEKN